MPADPNVNYFPDWNNPNGKEPVDLSTLTGTTLVIPVGGQSNTTNVTPSLYVPTNRLNVINFNICDGGAYRAKSGGGAIDPLLGCSGNVSFGLSVPWPNGNWIGILADNLVTAGIANNVIIVPFGVGGSFIADWASGGSNNSRVRVMAARLARAGLVPNAILWGQGESDLMATSQADYTTRLLSLIATFRIYWPSTGIPIFIAKESYINGLTDSNVTNAQASVVNNAIGIYAGPNGDARTAAYRAADNTHWNTLGASTWASDWQAVLHAYGAPF
ncbi:sialate O-acetylesterase [Bradyrhizobium sp. SZCCHNR1039]|uniref:sialate O-acetylesterase n=1 Tax=Bradyrhizobium sp. SZCCHNR1039 TaxID=3057350 RepID=UPI002915F121|nr:sialate O-acetylesterase [Bradyrhizobium sp. SZCCHNR1039]